MRNVLAPPSNPPTRFIGTGRVWLLCCKILQQSGSLPGLKQHVGLEEIALWRVLAILELGMIRIVRYYY